MIVSRLLTVAVTAVALGSCNDPFGPLDNGATYHLTQIDGAALPWATPLGDQITAGSIRLDDTLAWRAETIQNGPSMTGWTQFGLYKLQLGMLIIRYERQPGPGPLHDVDTFYVGSKGLAMREAGYVGRLSPLVRFYARP